MRKIIITVIAIFFLTAPFEKAKGQQTIIHNSPSVNTHMGANVGLSFWIWRFEIFSPQVGSGFLLFEDKMVAGLDGDGMDFQLFRNTFSLRLAYLGFKVTERDIIRFGMHGKGNFSHFAGYLNHFFLEYVRSHGLSQRTSLDFSMGSIIADVGTYYRSFMYAGMEAGVRWNYEIIPNLNFGVQLRYIGLLWVDNVPLGTSPTRNFIDFSVGLHYNIQLIRRQQQTPQRPPRQRVTPHQRALPCPPGQMRHLRSWDRPSSVFNHPTAR